MSSDDKPKPRTQGEADQLVAAIRRATGRSYPAIERWIATVEARRELAALAPELRRELAVLARDLDAAADRQRREGRREAWMRGRV
jgi:hypothetical protein